MEHRMVAPSGEHAAPWTRLQLGAASASGGVTNAEVLTFGSLALEIPSSNARGRIDKTL